LFGLAETVRVSLAKATNEANPNVYISTSRKSVFVPLPLSVAKAVADFPHVTAASHTIWFGGIHPDGRSQLPVYGIGVPEFFVVNPGFVIEAEERNDFLRDKQAALIGMGVARRFGWKKGDRVSVGSTVFEQLSGSKSWDLNIAGIYSLRSHSTILDDASVFINYAYINDSVSNKDSVSWITTLVDPAARDGSFAQKLDATFLNSGTPTRTVEEGVLLRQIADQMGNISGVMVALIIAVLITVLLILGSSIFRAVRDRTREFGILRAVGFHSAVISTYIVGELVLYSLLATVVGTAISALMVSMSAAELSQFLPLSGMPRQVWGTALVCGCALPLLAAIWPIVKAHRVTTVQALRE
jgi:putative ABC transport system permease protein